MSKKETTVKKEDAIEKAAPAATAVAALYATDAGVGFEHTTRDDYTLPFLKLLQKMSPEVDADDSAYLEGARAGMFFDTATGELLETADFIPCYYRRAIVEWREREAGGGFVAQHEPGYEQQFARDDSGRWRTPTGTYLVDTRYFFGLRLRADQTTTFDVLAFSATQAKKARTWLTRMQALKFVQADGTQATLPLFAHVWQLSSVSEENEKGSWRGYKLELKHLIQDPNLLKQAKQAHETFAKTAMNVGPPAAAPASEDVPF